MDLNLINKRAVVCGSTGGIGKAAAIELSRLGVNITLIARNEEKHKEIVKLLDETMEQKHHFIVADVGEPDKLQSELTSYLKKFPVNHILVNNTGGPAGGQAIDAEPADFIDTFNRHLICNQILTRA